jgi:hypothetical protein
VLDAALQYLSDVRDAIQEYPAAFASANHIVANLDLLTVLLNGAREAPTLALKRYALLLPLSTKEAKGLRLGKLRKDATALLEKSLSTIKQELQPALALLQDPDNMASMLSALPMWRLWHCPLQFLREVDSSGDNIDMIIDLSATLLKLKLRMDARLNSIQIKHACNCLARALRHAIPLARDNHLPFPGPTSLKARGDELLSEAVNCLLKHAGGLFYGLK